MNVLNVVLYFMGRAAPVELAIVWEECDAPPAPGEVTNTLADSGGLILADGGTASWDAEQVEYMEVRIAEVEVGGEAAGAG
jgi:hypothetical protein